jgi:thiamine transport system ATP-binding protein
VLTGRAAAYVWSLSVGAGGDPPRTLALRRSAVRVAPLGTADEGAVAGTVVSARLTSEQWRVVVDHPEAGRLDAVADATLPIRAGERVRLDFDASRMAALD